jgi:small-conductance mechanosensitive channel
LPLVAGLGVVGAGVALATQGVLSNLVAGLSIILSKPFRVGRVLKDVTPVIGVASVTDSVIQISIGPWVSVDDYAAATAEITRATLEALRARQIRLPPPQREVRLLNSAP